MTWTCAILPGVTFGGPVSEAQLTAQSPPALPAELPDWPACTLGEAQLGDLELLTSGAFAPLRGFMDAADAAAVAEHGTLADGTPWPVPVILDVPAGAVPADVDRLVLQDPEGSPLAVLSITERRAAPGRRGWSGWPGRSRRCASPSTGRSVSCAGARRTCAPNWPLRGRVARGQRARLRDPAPPQPTAHRPAAPLRGPAERPPAGAAPGQRASRDRDPAGGAGPRGAGGQAASSGRHARGPRAARAA